MPIRKTYQSLEGIPLSVNITKGDTLTTIDFTGGIKHPVVRYPKFFTDDETLQKLMESYPGFRKSYDLILIEAIDELGQVIEVMDPKADPDYKDEPKNEIIIKNLGAAKSYLKKEFNIIAAVKSNREDVNELFALQGLKLILETDKKQ